MAKKDKKKAKPFRVSGGDYKAIVRDIETLFERVNVLDESLGSVLKRAAERRGSQTRNEWKAQ